MISSLRQLQEKVCEHVKDLFVSVVKFRKDLCKQSAPDSILRFFHQGLMRSVRSGGLKSDPFIVANEKKVVFTHHFYSLCNFFVMLETAFEYIKEGMRYNLSSSGWLFIEHRFKQDCTNSS